MFFAHNVSRPHIASNPEIGTKLNGAEAAAQNVAGTTLLSKFQIVSLKNRLVRSYVNKSAASELKYKTYKLCHGGLVMLKSTLNLAQYAYRRHNSVETHQT